MVLSDESKSEATVEGSKFTTTDKYALAAIAGVGMVGLLGDSKADAYAKKMQGLSDKQWDLQNDYYDEQKSIYEAETQTLMDDLRNEMNYNNERDEYGFFNDDNINIIDENALNSKIENGYMEMSEKAQEDKDYYYSFFNNKNIKQKY